MTRSSSFRLVLAAGLALSLTGFGPSFARSYWEVLSEFVGDTIAAATLVVGAPDRVTDLPDGRRAYSWDRSRLTPRGGPRCVHTLYALPEGRARSLAAWRVTAIELPAPGCEPVSGVYAKRENGPPWRQRY